MNNVLTDTFKQLKQPTVIAFFVSLGIHLLAFSGLQAATRRTLDPKPALAVDVVELSIGDIERLPTFVQEELAPGNSNSSTVLFPPLPGGTNLRTTLPEPNGTNGQEFYGQNFNSPYLDSFIGSLPPPPPDGLFNGSSTPILADPIPLGAPNLAPSPLETALPAQAKPSQTNPVPSNPTPQAPTSSSPPSIAPGESTILETDPEPNPPNTVDPSSEPLLASAVSQMQALQAEYRDRYSYDPAGTSMGEATATLQTLLIEMRSATNQPELVPESPISDTLPFPDPVCPQNTGGVAILVLTGPQGDFIKSELIRSSGYKTLDDQALASVKQRDFTSQAKGRYTIYQYQISFSDLDRICRVDNANAGHSHPTIPTLSHSG